MMNIPVEWNRFHPTSSAFRIIQNIHTHYDPPVNNTSINTVWLHSHFHKKPELVPVPEQALMMCMSGSFSCLFLQFGVFLCTALCQLYMGCEDISAFYNYCCNNTDCFHIISYQTQNYRYSGTYASDSIQIRRDMFCCLCLR